MESEHPRRPKATRRPAGPMGLLLAGLLICVAGGSLLSDLARARSSPRGRYWHTCVRAEILSVIAIVNYVLTPEDDCELPALTTEAGSATNALFSEQNRWLAGQTNGRVWCNRPLKKELQ